MKLLQTAIAQKLKYCRGRKELCNKQFYYYQRRLCHSLVRSELYSAKKQHGIKFLNNLFVIIKIYYHENK
jgi:hypothetical protein